MKTLLIVFHTGGVKTAKMAEAVERGARTEEGVRVVMKRCAEAGPEDVLGADGLVLGTPENFGYMSGMMKDFLERIFYACEGKIEGRPWALFVGAGGRRLGPRAVQVRLKQWAVKQGLDKSLHPHSLRHSFASHVLQSSGDLRAVQEMLGHASISTTQVYTQLDFQHLAKVYDAAHPRARRKV